ncbi:MAG TPA: PaaI family thioesterase [Burkholderiales bacterium]|nr:PaaI family thioesterase [Burkholderiales bacterium]
MAAGDWESEMQAALARFTGPDVSTVETLRAQSGLDLLRGMVEGRVPRPPITDTLNFYLIEVERGRAVFQGTPKPAFFNPIGSIHGGWTATLLDSCMACAVHTTVPAGQGYTTVEFKLNLVRPVMPDSGPLRAEGKVISTGRTIATSEGRLVDESGRLYAHGTETCLIFPL